MARWRPNRRTSRPSLPSRYPCRNRSRPGRAPRPARTAAAQRRAHRRRGRPATTATMPTPRLKVSSSWSRATAPVRAIRSNTGCGVQVARSTVAASPSGQHARQIAGQPAAGDVREGVRARLVGQGEAVEGVDPRRAPAVPRPASGRQFGRRRVQRQAAALEQDVADQRVPVRVQPRGPEADQHVAGPHALGAQHGVRVHDPDAGARTRRTRPRPSGRGARRSRRRRARSRPGRSPRRSRARSSAIRSGTTLPVAM